MNPVRDYDVKETIMNPVRNCDIEKTINRYRKRLFNEGISNGVNRKWLLDKGVSNGVNKKKKSQQC